MSKCRGINPQIPYLQGLLEPYTIIFGYRDPQGAQNVKVLTARPASQETISVPQHHHAQVRGPMLEHAWHLGTLVRSMLQSLNPEPYVHPSYGPTIHDIDGSSHEESMASTKARR